MGGPAAGVLLAQTLDERGIRELDSMIAAISASRKDEDFWVANTGPIGGSFETNEVGEMRPFVIGRKPIETSPQAR